MRKFVIGITGSIGTGKSSAAKYLGKYGFSVINVDTLYRRLYVKGSPLQRRLVNAFGKGILKKNGAIDRPALRKIVFNDPKKLRLLNRIAHPAILKATKGMAARTKNPAVIDAPLLLEAKFDRLCDFVIVVHCPRKIVLRRLLKARKLTKKEILSIMKSQMPFPKKRKHADFLVDTSGSYAKTYTQLRAIMVKLKRNRPNQ